MLFRWNKKHFSVILTGFHSNEQNQLFWKAKNPTLSYLRCEYVKKICSVDFLNYNLYILRFHMLKPRMLISYILHILSSSISILSSNKVLWSPSNKYDKLSLQVQCPVQSVAIFKLFLVDAINWTFLYLFVIASLVVNF